jgi:hypothetical protein
VNAAQRSRGHDLPQHLYRNLKFHTNFMLTLVNLFCFIHCCCSYTVLVRVMTLLYSGRWKHNHYCSQCCLQLHGLCQLQCIVLQNVDRIAPFTYCYNSISIFHSDDTFSYTCSPAVILPTKIYVCTLKCYMNMCMLW